MRFAKPAAILVLLAGISWGAHSVHAAEVGNAITANQAKAGTVTGAGSDSYLLTVSNNKSFVALLSETGVHDRNFQPRLTITGSDNSGQDGAAAYVKDFGISHPANGSWTVKVSRGDPQNASGGSYSLTLIQTPLSGATALSSSPQAGSSDTSKVDAWTFNGTAGHSVSLAIATTGDKSFAPHLYVFTPSGVLVTSTSCSGCDVGVDVTESGTWSVAASKATDDGSTGSYTLSVADAN